MHPRHSASLIFFLGFAAAAFAQPLYWNPNATSPLTGGNGTWDNNLTAAWNLSPGGSASLLNWSSDLSVAVFRGNGGTVTLGDDGVTVSGVRFDAIGYTLIGSLTNNAHSYIGYTSGSASSVTYTGDGSVWNSTSSFYVGNNASGTLTVSDSAKVTVGRNGYIGYAAGIAGSLVVTDLGSQWSTSGFLHVGYSGVGDLTVQNRGVVSSGDAYIGSSPGSEGSAIITGAGSSSSHGWLFIGSRGTGHLTIANGGTTSSDISYLGYHAGSSGTVRVTGADSSWFGGGSEITVGYDGTGVLTIADQGKVTVGDGSTTMLRLGSRGGSSGTLNIGEGGAAGTLLAGSVMAGGGTGGPGIAVVNFNHTDSAYRFTPNLQAELSVNHLGTGTTILAGSGNVHTGPTNVSAGTLLVEGWVANSAITVASGATLGGTGLIGSPSVTILSGGHLSPGNALPSPGTLSFTGNLTLNAGSILDFQLGATSDQIVLGGGGLFTVPTEGTVTLNLSDAGGFSAGTYTLFDFLTARLHDDFSLDAFAFGEVIPGYDFHLNLDLANDRLHLVATASAIPEPSTYAALVGLATLGFAAWRRRSKRNADPQLAWPGQITHASALKQVGTPLRGVR